MKFTEEDIRKITLTTVEELGENATIEKVQNVVSNVVKKLSENNFETKYSSKDSGRIILTSFGLNKTGIIAAITKKISDNKCDIIDLTQKLMDDFFTMIMIINISNSPKDYNEIVSEMNLLADELKIKIYIQHEEIFTAMHRI